MRCRLCAKPLKDNRRKRCQACNTKIRRIRTKAAAIEYLGGVCARCGYDAHPAAMQFHHINPEQKSFTIGGVANRSWEIVKAELDKCELICANCHQIEHSNRTEQRWLDEAALYSGRLLAT